MNRIEVSRVKEVIEIIKKQRNYFVSPYLDQRCLIDEEIIRTKIFNYEWIVFSDLKSGVIIILDNPRKPLLINYSEIIYIGELNIFIDNFDEYISFIEEILEKVYKKDALIFIEDIIYNNKLSEKFRGSLYIRSGILKKEFNGNIDIQIYHKLLVEGDKNELY